MVKAGEAYGIFYCGRDAAAVQKELPFVRKAAEVPPGLELRLTECSEKLKEPWLATIAALAGEADRGLDMNFDPNFVLAASCPGLSNEKTASELADVFRMLYAPPLYQSGEPFRAEVVYDNGKKYVTFD